MRPLFLSHPNLYVMNMLKEVTKSLTMWKEEFDFSYECYSCSNVFQKITENAILVKIIEIWIISDESYFESC